eukprot:Clim_evm53s146 gene=Clim_evmTU53s146
MADVPVGSADAIKFGEYVILDNTKTMKIALMKKNEVIRMHKAKFTLNCAVNYPYGTTFDVVNAKLVPHSGEMDEFHGLHKVAAVSEGSDNRRINDDMSNQSLSAEEVAKLRAEGVTGADMIEKLRQSHAAWDEKTEYSKAKWLRTKAKKHLQVITIHKATPRRIAECLIDLKPSKILNMRPSVLAQLLTHANCQAGGRYLVFDDTQGYITGAVLNRTQTYAEVVTVTFNAHPVFPRMNYYNLPQEVQDTMKWMDARKLPDVYPKAYFDSLIVVARCDLSALVPKLIPFLKYGGTFVVYHPIASMLAPILLKMKMTRTGGALMLFDTFQRGYQVLPNRTHPFVNMKGCPGHLLTGVRIKPDADDE